MKALLKIYAFTLLVLLVSTCKTVYRGNPSLFDWLDVAFSALAVVGLISYAFAFGIGSPRFWGRFLYALISWDLLYQFVLTYWLGLAQDFVREPAPLYAFVVTILILIPEYLALYRYGKMEGPARPRPDRPGPGA